MEPTILIGDRVIVKDMVAQDVPQYYEWFWESNPETMTCRPRTRKPVEDVIKHMREHFEKKDVLFLAIRLREDGKFLGRLTLFDLNELNRSIELGYMIGPPYRGQGLAREAVGLVLKHVFDTMKLNKVSAQTGSFNTQSMRLLEHFRFHRDGCLRQHHMYEGVLHDDYLYSLLAEEYYRELRQT